MSQKNQWDNSCLVITFLQQKPATTCLLTNRTHGTADTGRKYMWIWQGVLKELQEPQGTCNKFLSDSTKIAAPRHSLWQGGEAESHGHPISAFQGQGKTVEVLSASVALTVWEIAVVITIKVNRDLSEIKWVSFLSGSNVRLGSLRIQEKEKAGTKLFKILTSVWLLDSELICRWMQKWGKERMLINTVLLVVVNRGKPDFWQWFLWSTLILFLESPMSWGFNVPEAWDNSLWSFRVWLGVEGTHRNNLCWFVMSCSLTAFQCLRKKSVRNIKRNLFGFGQRLVFFVCFFDF